MNRRQTCVDLLILCTTIFIFSCAARQFRRSGSFYTGTGFGSVFVQGGENKQKGLIFRQLIKTYVRRNMEYFGDAHFW